MKKESKETAPEDPHSKLVARTAFMKGRTPVVVTVLGDTLLLRTGTVTFETDDTLTATGPGATRHIYSAGRPAPKIAKPPGIYMSRIGGFLCSRRHYEAVITQVVGDMQREYIEALAGGASRARLTMIRVRGWWEFAKAMHLLKFFGVIERIAK